MNLLNSRVGSKKPFSSTSFLEIFFSIDSSSGFSISILIDRLSLSTILESFVSLLFSFFIELEEFSVDSVLIISESVISLSIFNFSEVFVLLGSFEKIFFSLSGFQLNSITIKQRKKNDNNIIKPISPIKSTIIELIS